MMSCEIPKGSVWRPPVTDWSAVDPEFLRWAEEKAVLTHAFAIESNDLVSRQGLTTLNWLFGLLAVTVLALAGGVGGRACSFAQASVAVLTAWQAVWLMLALRLSPTTPPGNQPSLLVTVGNLTRSLAEARVSHLMSLEDRIAECRARNLALAEAVHSARAWFCGLALATGAMGLLLAW